MNCYTAKENYLLSEKLFRHSEYETEYETILDNFREKFSLIIDYNIEIVNNSVIYKFTCYKQNFSKISLQLEKKVRFFILEYLLNCCAMQYYKFTYFKFK